MILRILLPLLLAASSAVAAPFAPSPLKISAPSQVNFHYGHPLTFPFTLSGGPASVGLAFFTSDRAGSIRDVRNGYLGWHYVNCIDTCVYFSPPQPFPPGENSIDWDGRDADGFRVVIDQHWYYLWAYDTESPPKKAFDAFRGYGLGRSALVVRDEQGNPLANPVLYSSAQSMDLSGETWNTRARWVLGGNPDDPALAETTRYRSRPDRGRMALNPRDHRRFFTQALEPGRMVTRAWEWTPSGDAVPQTEFWGDDGLSAVSSALDPETAAYSGPVSYGGDYLFSGNFGGGETGSYPTLDGFEVSDGSLVVRFNLSPWYGEDTAPTELENRNETLFLSSPRSALFRVVNPLAGAEDENNFVVWENGVGDGFADTPPAPGKPRPTTIDSNGFVLFAENGITSFRLGIFAPDGVGAGYWPITGVSGIDGIRVVDTGSPFDGVYFGGKSTVDNEEGVWYARYAECRGLLKDPAEWWHAHVFIVFPWEGDTLSAGKTYSVKWHGIDCGALRLEFSTNEGVSWTTVANNVAHIGYYGEYLWRVPDVRSSTCRLRLTSTVNPLLENTSRAFTISGPVAVADDTPQAFGLRPNTPNPFNPSTTLSFTLTAPGNVSLTVYDATGRKVTELANKFHAAGEHSAVWNAKDCASGVYFAVLKSGERRETRKMLLVR